MRFKLPNRYILNDYEKVIHETSFYRNFLEKEIHFCFAVLFVKLFLNLLKKHLFYSNMRIAIFDNEMTLFFQVKLKAFKFTYKMFSLTQWYKTIVPNGVNIQQILLKFRIFIFNCNIKRIFFFLFCKCGDNTFLRRG